MPFKSEAQRRYMWAKHPRLARKWSHEYPGQHDLPYHKRKKKAVHQGLPDAPTLVDRLLAPSTSHSPHSVVDSLLARLPLHTLKCADDAQDSPESTVDADAAGNDQGPPNYHMAGLGAPNTCKACQHYDPINSGCVKYSVPVDMNATCDDFTPNSPDFGPPAPPSPGNGMTNFSGADVAPTGTVTASANSLRDLSLMDPVVAAYLKTAAPLPTSPAPVTGSPSAPNAASGVQPPAPQPLVPTQPQAQPQAQGQPQGGPGGQAPQGQQPPPPPPGSFQPSPTLAAALPGPATSWHQGVMGAMTPQTPLPTPSQDVASGQQLANSTGKAASLVDRLLEKMAYPFGPQPWAIPSYGPGLSPFGGFQQQYGMPRTMPGMGGFGSPYGMGVGGFSPYGPPAGPGAGRGMGGMGMGQFQGLSPAYLRQRQILSGQLAQLQAMAQQNPRLGKYLRRQITQLQQAQQQLEAVHGAHQQVLQDAMRPQQEAMARQQQEAQAQQDAMRQQAEAVQQQAQARQRQQAASQFNQASQAQGYLEDFARQNGEDARNAWADQQMANQQKQQAGVGGVSQALGALGLGGLQSRLPQSMRPGQPGQTREQVLQQYQDPALKNLYGSQAYQKADPATKAQMEKDFRAANPAAMTADQLSQSPRFRDMMNGVYGAEGRRRAQAMLQHAQTLEAGGQTWDQVRDQYNKQYGQTAAPSPTPQANTAPQSGQTAPGTPAAANPPLRAEQGQAAQPAPPSPAQAPVQLSSQTTAGEPMPAGQPNPYTMRAGNPFQTAQASPQPPAAQPAVPAAVAKPQPVAPPVVAKAAPEPQPPRQVYSRVTSNGNAIAKPPAPSAPPPAATAKPGPSGSIGGGAGPKPNPGLGSKITAT